MVARSVHFKWFFVAALLLLVLGVSVFVVGQALSAASSVLWESEQSDVSTKIELKKSTVGQWELLGTFKPTRERFHLYSKDLPKKGIRGVGRPTLIEVVSSPKAIKWTGALKAYQVTHDILYEPMNLALPVYPEGAVTLGLPFELLGSPSAVSVELSITYMACSDETCLSPVMDKRFTVTIPSLQ